jgi:uncharacterized protein YvpB
VNKRVNKKIVSLVVFVFALLILFGLFFVPNGVKKPVIVDNPKNIIISPKEDVTKDVPINNPVNKPKPPVLSELDKKILATLVKEDLPKDIANIKLVRLNVPYFQQEYKRSCEEASLRMVLAFYGIETNDMEIVERVGYNPRPWDIKNNIWDDPNKMFVGSIDDPNKSGYGAFAPAIAAAAKTFGHDAESYLGVSAQFIAEQIYNGYPVIVWGFFNTPPFTKYSWETPEGIKITAYRGEHARVVVGVLGDPMNPVGFLLHDPLTGERDVYWSASRLMTQMNMFGNLTNQAVVVR